MGWYVFTDPMYLRQTHTRLIVGLRWFQVRMLTLTFDELSLMLLKPGYL
jgi:hypothetical protein